MERASDQTVRRFALGAMDRIQYKALPSFTSLPCSLGLSLAICAEEMLTKKIISFHVCPNVPITLGIRSCRTFC